MWHQQKQSTITGQTDRWTDEQTDIRTDTEKDGQTDDGQSDPFVALCFTVATKNALGCMS